MTRSSSRTRATRSSARRRLHRASGWRLIDGRASSTEKASRTVARPAGSGSSEAQRSAISDGERSRSARAAVGVDPCAGSGRVDLAGLLDRLRPLLGDLASGKRLDIAVRAEAPIVARTRRRVEQVLLNLCGNAAEAIPPRGRRDPGRDPRSAPGRGRGSDVGGASASSDNGRGMDAETLSHVFEPYFSRKVSGAASVCRSSTGS